MMDAVLGIFELERRARGTAAAGGAGLVVAAIRGSVVSVSAAFFAVAVVAE